MSFDFRLTSQRLIAGKDRVPPVAKPCPASPSDMPDVQRLISLRLNHVAQGRLTLRRFIELTSSGPQRVFGLVGKGRIALGYDADFTIVDLKKRWTVGSEWLVSRCAWSPFEGDILTGKATGTIIRGSRVMWEDTLANQAIGEPVRFEATAFG